LHLPTSILSIAQWTPATAVFLASLAGSGHCVAMCGPLITQRSSRSPVYHLGRLVSYVGLGALAGWIGESIVPWRWLNWGATIGLCIFFLYSALRLWKGGKEISLIPSFLRPYLEKPLLRVLSTERRTPWTVFLFGMLTALLPCGWLHTFLVAALATGSPARSAVLLFAFWLGTVPALAVGTGFVRRLLAPFGRRYPAAVGILLLLAAIGTVTFRTLPLVLAEDLKPAHSCH
jgi:uncharacterized protein